MDERNHSLNTANSLNHMNNFDNYNSTNLNSPFYVSNSSYRPTYEKNKYNSITLSKNLDEETEQEAINMIKTQNRKIQELFEELNRRDETIQTLQIQLGANENYKLQNENFKRQINILEEKLRLYETDYSSKSSYLNEQLKHVSEAESKLRNQIIAKDKIIHDFDNVIKDQENQLNSYKKQAIDKESIIAELKQDFNEISAKFKNITLRLNMKEEEWKKIREALDLKVKESNKEKILLEEKLSQLIEIVKQYSKELSEYNVQIQSLETEKRSITKLNNRLHNELEESNKKIKELENALENMKEVKEKLFEAESAIKNFKNVIQSERNKNDHLSRNNSDLSDKIQQIKEKYSGENSLENLKNTIQASQNENMQLTQANEELNKTIRQYETRLRNLENDNKEIINVINLEIKTISQWLETYYGVFYDKNYDIPDLPVTLSKSIKNKTKFDTLKQTLVNNRSQINEELSKYDSQIKDLKKEIGENFNKQEKMQKEISQLKELIIVKDEEIFSLNNEIEEYHSNLQINKDNLVKIKNDINESKEVFNKFLEKLNTNIKQEFEEILQNEKMKELSEFIYRSNYCENLKSEVEDNLEKLIQILKILIKEFHLNENKNEQQQILKSENENLRKEIFDKVKNFKEELDKLEREKVEMIRNLERIKEEDFKASEGNLKFSLEKVKKLLKEREEKCEELIGENEFLRNQLDLMEKKISQLKSNREGENEINEELNEKSKLLEKKLKNLMTELELKDLQIKSQEQMIQRRAAEIQELKKNMLNNSNENLINYDKEKIRTLEVLTYK